MRSNCHALDIAWTDELLVLVGNINPQIDIFGYFALIFIGASRHPNLKFHPCCACRNRHYARRYQTRNRSLALRGALLAFGNDHILEGKVAVAPVRCGRGVMNHEVERDALLGLPQQIRLRNDRCRIALADERLAFLRLQADMRNIKTLFVKNPPLALDRLPEARLRHDLSAGLSLESGKGKAERQRRIPP